MGIQTLKPFLEKHMVKSSLREFSGNTIGIDAFSIMYAATRAVVEVNNSRINEFKQGRFHKSCTDFCMRRIEGFKKYGVIPFLVFDGDKLQLKQDHQSKKRKRGDEQELKIQPSHVYDLIKVLKQKKVLFVVAPYEADAQLAWMAFNNVVQAVQSDDTDLVLYGCPKVLFNLQIKTGECSVCELNAILEKHYAAVSREQFVYACLFCESDYMEWLSTRFKKDGVDEGLKLIQQMGSHVKVIDAMFKSKSKQMDEAACDAYKRKLDMVVRLYKHQCIYDMHNSKAAYLTNLPESFTSDADTSLEYLGKLVPNFEVRGIADGFINPRTWYSLVKEDLVIRLSDFGKYYSLTQLSDRRVDFLPYVIRILLESALRNCIMIQNLDVYVKYLLKWEDTSQRKIEIGFRPACVLSEVSGSDTDYHSVDEVAGSLDVSQSNTFVLDEREEDSVWGSTAIRNMIISHLKSDKVVRDTNGILYPDSVVGTNSFTSLIGGLGVAGWTVSSYAITSSLDNGGHIYMAIPSVVGVELCGHLKTGVSSGDIISLVAAKLKDDPLKHKFVEFHGDGVRNLQIHDRVVVAKRALDFGVKMAFFPFDNISLEYLNFIGINQDNVRRVESYLGANKMFVDYTKPQQKLKYSTCLKIQLADV